MRPSAPAGIWVVTGAAARQRMNEIMREMDSASPPVKARLRKILNIEDPGK